MAIPLSTNYSFGNAGGASGAAITPAELYGKVSKSLLAQNAGVQKLSAQLSSSQSRLSSLGQLQSALANFQSLAQSLVGDGVQTGATASVPSVLNAVTKASARPGTYQVDVQQLAQAQVLTARPQKTQDAVIGNGAATTIKIETGTQAGKSFTPGAGAKTITIDSSNNTLEGIAAAFKSAGVDATVVKGASGYSLQLTGQSGSANSLRISVAGDADVQKLLAYNPGGVQNLNQSKAAQDALLTIDGKQVASASNVVTGQIAGTALALTATGSTKVTVAQEPGAIAKNVGNFVSSFNSLAAKLKSLQQGELRTDGALQQAQEQLSQLIGRNQESLAKAGVTPDKNGQLQIDSKVLQAAVGADAGAVAKLFTGGGQGVADQLDAKIGQLLGANSSISKQKSSLDRDIAVVSSQKATITKTLTAQANALVARYAQVSQVGEANNGLPGLPGGGATSLFDFLA